VQQADRTPVPLPLEGRVALITGANTGIGRVTALRLAGMGASVFLACRSEARTAPVIDEIRAANPAAKAGWLALELSDFDSVRDCATRFLALGLPLHLLVNNAGIAGARGSTASGFELAFGINHVGHFLLTRLLLERIKQSTPARVVTVASKAHRRVDGIDWKTVRRPTSTLLAVREYATSKLANVLFSAELGRRLKGSGVSTYALHPGVIDSDIWRRLPAPLRALNRRRLISTEEGAQTTLYCATSAPADETGLYYSDSRPATPSAAAQDASLAAELWRRSEEWTDAVVLPTSGVDRRPAPQ
jgi:NAD(P)-dependent dehydrogenase (short-subunit alcohol dehydrogenase family)